MSIAIGTKARSIESDAQQLEIIAPFLSRAVLNELCSGRCFEEYRRRRLERLRAKRMHGLWIQRQMGLENAQRETRFVDGLGQHIATIDPEIYGATELRYGAGCWRDKSFLKHTLDRSPELRVPAPAPRFIQVNGFRDSRAQNDPDDVNGPTGGAGMVREGDPTTIAPGDWPKHETPALTISEEKEKGEK